MNLRDFELVTEVAQFEENEPWP